MKKNDPPGRPGCAELAPSHHRKHENDTKPLPDDAQKGKSEPLAVALSCPEGQNAPYRPLSTEFAYSGFGLTQVKRIGNVAIYKQTKGKQSPAYEVVIIRNAESKTAFGHEFPAAEYYPRSEDWGTYAFTYSALAEVERKFEKLLRHAKNGRAQ
jgi:hypothetical protein